MNSSAASLLRSPAHRRGVRGLYRAILRTHRKRLPQNMRDLGDAFVSQEFRLHMDVQDGKVVTAFLAQWREYLTTLRSAAGNDPAAGEQKEGAPLDEDELAALSDDQRKQLHRLRTTLIEEKEKD